MVLRAGTGASVLPQRSSSGATFVAMMQSIDLWKAIVGQFRRTLDHPLRLQWRDRWPRSSPAAQLPRAGVYCLFTLKWRRDDLCEGASVLNGRLESGQRGGLLGLDFRAYFAGTAYRGF